MAATIDETNQATNSTNSSLHPFYNHPKVQEMRTFGFGNEEQIKESFLVYLDLVEAKRWWNVRVVACNSLQQILVCGQSGQREPVEVILALRQDNQLTVCHLQELLSKIKHEHGSSALTLAMMDSDSSIVYYKISDGFIPPDPPEALQLKKKQRQRKFQQRRTRFIHSSSHMDQERQQVFADANRANLVLAGSPGSDENHVAGESKECHMVDAAAYTQRLPGAAKRSHSEPDEHAHSAKHMKLGDEAVQTGHSHTENSNEQDAEAGPSFDGAAAQHRRYDDNPGEQREDEGVQLGVLHAPVMDHDSDHDSGMDAGEDDEDEGFDEEL